MTLLDDIQIAACARCGVPCRVADRSTPDARLLRHATVPEGLCPDCAMTQFLQGIETLGPRIERNGPACLLNSALQEHMAVLLTLGKADATASDLNWQRIVDNWALPFPVARRQRKQRGGRS